MPCNFSDTETEKSEPTVETAENSDVIMEDKTDERSSESDSDEGEEAPASVTENKSNNGPPVEVEGHLEEDSYWEENETMTEAERIAERSARARTEYVNQYRARVEEKPKPKLEFYGRMESFVPVRSETVFVPGLSQRNRPPPPQPPPKINSDEGVEEEENICLINDYCRTFIVDIKVARCSNILTEMLEDINYKSEKRQHFQNVRFLVPKVHTDILHRVLMWADYHKYDLHPYFHRYCQYVLLDDWDIHVFSLESGLVIREMLLAATNLDMFVLINQLRLWIELSDDGRGDGSRRAVQLARQFYRRVPILCREPDVFDDQGEFDPARDDYLDEEAHHEQKTYPLENHHPEVEQKPERPRNNQNHVVPGTSSDSDSDHNIVVTINKHL